MCPPPPDSDSELSLSGFETVASHSFDNEDDDEDKDRFMFSIPHGSPAGMSQEDRQVDGDEARANGMTEHRSELQRDPPPQPVTLMTLSPQRLKQRNGVNKMPFLRFDFGSFLSCANASEVLTSASIFPHPTFSIKIIFRSFFNLLTQVIPLHAVNNSESFPA